MKLYFITETEIKVRVMPEFNMFILLVAWYTLKHTEIKAFFT